MEEEDDDVKVITREDLRIEEDPDITKVLSARFGCPIELDTVHYNYTPFYTRDISWSDVVNMAGWDEFRPMAQEYNYSFEDDDFLPRIIEDEIDEEQ